MRLVGTTKPTIESIRSRTHWNANNLQPMDPVTLGLCSQIDLDFEVEKAAKNAPPQEAQPEGATLLPASETTARPPWPHGARERAAAGGCPARRRPRGRCGLRQAQVDDRAGIAEDDETS